jgi:ATP-dependent Zn protease
MILAGAAAESKFDSSEVEHGLEDDAEQALAAAFYATTTDRTCSEDWLALHEKPDQMKKTIGNVINLIDEAEADADRLVDEYQAAVTAVADALIERHELTGEEVRVIVLATKVDPC